MNTRFEDLTVAPAMSSGRCLFTVVIASLCNDARGELLKRACDSVRTMAGDYDYSIIVVANGPYVSPVVLDWLATRPDIRVIRLRSGSHPLARRVGAEMAESEFLAFLDDDDELMPNTLAMKVAHFREHPEIDVLITDGWRVSASTITRIYPPRETRSADFVETMMRASWGACALTLRARNVDLSVFDTELRHMEWTLTALELARRYRLGFLDEPTYRYYETTPNSLSKTAEHTLAGPEVWRRLSRGYAGTRYHAAMRRRYGAMCHIASWECVRQDKMRDAWRFHIDSLRALGGVTFVRFSAKLILVSLRRLIRPRRSPERVNVNMSDPDDATLPHRPPLPR